MLFRLMGERVLWNSITTLAGAALVSALLFFSFESSFISLEDQAGSLPWLLASDSTPEERIAIVAIDERSIADIGPWPWPRQVMARLVDSINEAGAQLQIHDILYPAGGRPNDDLLLAALARDGKSIIAQLPVLESQKGTLRSGVLTNPVTGLSCSASDEGLKLPVATDFIGSSDVFVPVPKGHIAPIIDADGAVRKVPALVCVDGEVFPALALAPFFQLINSEEWGAETVAGSGVFSPEHLITFKSYPGLEVPLDGDGNMRISFLKSPSSFSKISAIDLLNGNFDPGQLDNVIVLVGATAFGLDDIVPTPYSGSSPGVELQARMLSSILDDQVPFIPSGSVLLTVLFSVALALVCLHMATRRGRYASIGLSVMTVSVPFLAISLHGIMLVIYGLWIGWVVPALFGSLASALLLIVEHARVRLERARVVQNLTSYLPIETAKKVAFESPSSLIQAERCNVTLLSADLRNFSALGERRPPEESASVLHYFFTKVSEIAERHGGRVHEYKGDNVLVIWNGDGVAPAINALNASLEIEKEINLNLLEDSGVEGLEPLAVGIGIEQGPVLLGSIGPAHRRAHTLCGETVSVTLRIQELTADLSYPILIGEVASRYLQDVSLKSLGHYMLPGLITAHVLSTPSAYEEERHDKKAELTLLKGGLR
ncbi:MAG: adenylate/guanylate cyclase domain-containing protein [Gammaproteobacteria bacterium]|nr:adenylate/guanylate cyclase domain-containing protein [Gammaproteobacteria bacterium]